MKLNKRWIVTIFSLLLFFTGLRAQQNRQAPATEHEQQVKDMVAFLEYVLNTLASRNTASRDKDVLIRESYAKIFRDAKVQIEDDLDENRKTITNKNVQAYLKDVDFFFDNATITFNIKGIQSKVNANNTLFYKVSLVRTLRGTNIEGKTVNNSINRFIEINYDPVHQDLKIVSIYTNELSQKDAMLNWWKQLSYEWQSIFKRKLNIIDSVQLAQIQDITAIQELDLSNNEYILNIEPLTQLVSLRKLNLSNTQVKDITPLRNLSELQELDLSYTQVEDIAPLRYSDKMKDLNISRTAIEDIAVVENMPALERFALVGVDANDYNIISTLKNLKYLNLEGTRIISLMSLSSLENIQELNISKIKGINLDPLKGLKSLITLDMDSTNFADVRALSWLEDLAVVSMNYTRVADITPLQKNPKIEKIYCDHTAVKRAAAEAFMAARPGVLVIVDTEDQRKWWDTLPDAWKEVFIRTAKISDNPAKEELARITSVDSINLSGNTRIRDLEPLLRLRKLQVVMAAGTGIRDLSPLKDHNNIHTLDISTTEVEDITMLKDFIHLKVLYADSSKIQNIDALQNIKTLERLYVDKTAIHDLLVQEFLEGNTECLVIYKTHRLEKWWSGLSDAWQNVFKTHVKINSTPTREELHQLAELTGLRFNDAPVNDLAPLSEFVRLKELQCAGTAITDITPVSILTSLRSLQVSRSPVRKLDPVAQLTHLQSLDISNTAIDDLKAINGLQELKKLNCSGTQIQYLDALKGLNALEEIDCSNTEVRRLDPLDGLSLKVLNCYNTKISTRRIEDYKAANPDCKVIYYR